MGSRVHSTRIFFGRHQILNIIWNCLCCTHESERADPLDQKKREHDSGVPYQYELWERLECQKATWNGHRFTGANGWVALAQGKEFRLSGWTAERIRKNLKQGVIWKLKIHSAWPGHRKNSISAAHAPDPFTARRTGRTSDSWNPSSNGIKSKTDNVPLRRSRTQMLGVKIYNKYNYVTTRL